MNSGEDIMLLELSECVHAGKPKNLLDRGGNQTRDL